MLMGEGGREREREQPLASASERSGVTGENGPIRVKMISGVPVFALTTS